MFRLAGLSFLFFVALAIGCKKNSISAKMWEFSFNYNGRTYTNPDYGSPIELNGEIIGIEIRKPEVLGGLVRFIWTTNCAYLKPTGMNIDYNDNSCTFYVSGGPVDSSLIYSYKSGGKENYTISNCREKKDPFNGGTITVWTISGAFSLVLINKAGVTKNITGTFKDPDVIR